MVLVLFALLSFSCSSSECSTLPEQFISYEDAIQKVKLSEFKFKEILNTSRSSWIKGANYYSCDGKTGFMIMRTSSEEYIHQNLPIAIWANLKNAVSFGKYYNYNIRGRYQLILVSEQH